MVFDPSILASLGGGATFVLAVVASLFAAGRIVPGSALERAEKRAEDAMKNTMEAVRDVARQSDTIAALTTELRETRLRGQR